MTSEYAINTSFYIKTIIITSYVSNNFISQIEFL